MDSKVIALSVAKPKWEDVRGSQVLTSIVRSPSSTPLYFGPDGLSDNATAVHTEQVLAFTAEHYDRWADYLKVDRRQWDWCHWGENITLLGLDENELRVGDVLAIGPEARFEVTSPRNPCFKLAWRLGQPDAILRTMVESGYIGFYLSVITPGLVHPGDAITVHRTDPSAITVADLARLLMGIGNGEPERLRQVLSLPALGGQARGMVSKRLTGLEDSARLGIGRWKGWRAFTVANVVEEAEDIRSFELAPVDGEPVAPYRAGQFLTVRLSDSEDGEAVSRAWSLSDYADHPDSYRVTIKRAHSGRGSVWMHELAEPGRRLLVRPPAGRFTLDRGGFMRAVLISAGIGITPMLAMLKAQALRSDAPPLLWIHVTRNGRSHVRAEETDALLKAHGFERQVFYSNPRPADAAGSAYDEAGRLASDRLTQLVTEKYLIAPFGRDIAMEGAHSDFYVCGPTAFEASVRETLIAIGVPEAHIHSESFGIAAGARRGAAVEQAEVVFDQARRTAAWSSDEDMTLLELAEAQGLQPNYACRLGLCGACEVALLEGEVAYDPAPSVLPPAGRVLACCARPATHHVRLGM